MLTERLLVLILEWFDVANATEPLIGDLLEELRSGRSHWWLWREVLVAVAGSVMWEIANNKFLCLRAIATGIIVATPLTLLFRRVAYFSWADGPLQFGFLTCCTYVVAGAAIGHKYPERRPATVIVFIVYAFIAKAAQIGLNPHQFFFPSHLFRSLVYVPLILVAPLFTLLGVILLPRPLKPPHRKSLGC
jgi:hypothetical protein